MGRTCSRRVRVFLCVLLGVLLVEPARASEPDVIELREAVVLRRQGAGGREPIQRDDILARLIETGFRAPAEGEAFERADGATQPWELLRAGEDGWLAGRALAGGYACFEVSSEVDRVMLLEAQAHSLCWVNGLPVTGDPYSLGILHAPIALRRGVNQLIFQCGRGRLRARLVAPESPVFFGEFDRTVPELVVGRPVDAWLGIVVVNASDAPLVGARVMAGIGGDGFSSDIGRIEAGAIRKVAVRVVGGASTAAGPVGVTLGLIDSRGASVADATLELEAVGPAARRRETFVSEIDGSVQYYSVVPSSGGGPGGLILSLHGAGVEARGQGAAYEPKDWATIVCPTNRRPFGFDWEDWGRKDAMEVLAIARERLGSDPAGTWLTGHSMGGHGTWHLGVTYPDRFAAIGPSAGWVSFWSYTGGATPEGESLLSGVLRSATLPSDTLALSSNLTPVGVYVLHGDADDNVPVDQARRMRARLGEFHGDFAYYERPGAGHWWGNLCVDWPALMEFFRGRELPDPGRVERVDFVTGRPGASSDAWWASIDRAVSPLAASEVHLRSAPGSATIQGTTQNVARLGLRVRSGSAAWEGGPAFKDIGDAGEVTITLDGQSVAAAAGSATGSTIWLERVEGEWGIAGARGEGKRAERMGPFKEVFDRRVILVYGTGGSGEERALARARALLDAQTFWYRGNGSIEVTPDTAFDAARDGDRNVVLYGNSDTNRAWAGLLGGSPVSAGDGLVRVGEATYEGADLVLLLARPRPGSEIAMVGAVAWSGEAGARLSASLPYFVSGVGYPDFMVIGGEALTRGNEGIRSAGYFGADWEMDAALTYGTAGR